MLFQVFSILFLIAQCAAVVEYTMKTNSPSEHEMATRVLTRLNDPRRSVIYDTNASNLHWLKWDFSLAWLAYKTIDTCEKLKDSNGFMQIRLRLSDKKVTTDTNTSHHLLIHDLWTNLEDFTDHIKETGADIDDSIKEFSKFYDFFRSDWTRVGCAFKVCKDLLTGEDTNLVCFLGPKTERTGPIFEMKDSKDELCKDCECDTLMCKEKPFDWVGLSDEDFQKKVLDEFNGARRQFALTAKASAMSKLTWSDDLATSAHDSGSKCPSELTHGPNYREVLADTFLDRAAGLSTLGDMYGSITVETSYKQIYDWTAFYTILWPQETKVGCARTPDCPNKVVCHFGEIGELDGKMYEKGESCSKCQQGCEEGLCT